jgi:hypothetical protein
VLSSGPAADLHGSQDLFGAAIYARFNYITLPKIVVVDADQMSQQARTLGAQMIDRHC